MTPFQIRHAMLADVPAITQLIEESVRYLNAADYTSSQIDSALRYLFGVDTQLIEDGTYFVAESDGYIVGCGGWSKRKSLFGHDQSKMTQLKTSRTIPSRNNTTLLIPQTDPAKIRALFVHPQVARQGIGRALMAAAEFAALQAGFNQLELMATLTGEPLYIASGFEVVERISITLPDGTPFSGAYMIKTANSMLGETAVSHTATQ